MAFFSYQNNSFLLWRPSKFQYNRKFTGIGFLLSLLKNSRNRGWA